MQNSAALVKLTSAPDLVDQVYQSLVLAISEGKLLPGTRLTQEDIAEQLAVSRQPVLQALRLLKKDGFVQDALGRGLVVAPLDAQWFAQVYEVRGALDALAVRLAAQSAGKLNGYQHNSALIERGRLAVNRAQLDQLIDLDVEFHCAIYRAANNPLIEQSAALHWRHIRRAMAGVLQSVSRAAVWDEHEAISLAIASGDAAKAEQLMINHGQKASIHLVSQLQNTADHNPASTQ